MGIYDRDLKYNPLEWPIDYLFNYLVQFLNKILYKSVKCGEITDYSSGSLKASYTHVKKKKKSIKYS